MLKSPELLTEIQAAVELAVLVVGHAHPHPDAEGEDQHDDGQRGDDHDGYVTTRVIP